VATSIQISYWHDDVRLFRRALEVSSDNYIAANCLGKAYEKLGDNVHALFFYRAAVETEPRFPQSQFNYAMCLLAFGQKDAALEHLQAAAALEPHNPDIQFNLGIYFTQQGNWTNAVHHFRNALLAQPDFSDAKKQLEELLVAHPGLP
jgi:tetratricopeptide (TPR) repeat protein